MLSLPEEMISMINSFSQLFSKSVFPRAQQLLVGAILCRGKRTVTSALRVLGLQDSVCFSTYHRVLNRAKWSALFGSRILLGLLVAFVPANDYLVVGIDETIERRKGRKIKGKGLYHDAARSLSKQKIYTFGLQWISMMLIIKLPFSSRRWALPFLTVFTPSKQYNLKMGYRHKTVIDWTVQMIMQVSRWLSGRSGYLLGDGAYACLHLAQVCRRCGWHLISRLRLDARIYAFPAEGQPRSRGKKAKKGPRLSSLKQRANDPHANWQTATINWYANQSMPIQFQSETCLWYRPALDPLPIRWVLVKDPQGKKETQAFFTTDLNLSATTILEVYLLRWNVEVTFEECRAHLGIETQRQWSAKAIERTTPVLMSLFSIVTLIATKMSKTQRIHPDKTIWYQKQQLTFSDLIIHVRYQIWRSIYYVTSTKPHKCVQLNLDTYETMLKQLACAA